MHYKLYSFIYLISKHKIININQGKNLSKIIFNISILLATNPINYSYNHLYFSSILNYLQELTLAHLSKMSAHKYHTIDPMIL